MTKSPRTPARADVLLVGAAGPIGRATTERMHSRGLRVVATARSGRLEPLDVSDDAQVLDVLARWRPRGVVYLASPVLTPSDADARQRAVRALRDLERFLHACAANDVDRFVFASSAAVYGDASPRRLRESDPLLGTSAYADFKRRAEIAVGGSRLSGASLRLFNVYGPRCHASLINRLVEGERPSLLMTSSFVRDYVDVRDVAEAIDAAVASPALGPINVGTGIGIDNLLLAGWARDEYAPVTGEGIQSFSVADATHAERVLGWTARRRVESVWKSLDTTTRGWA